MGVGHKRLDPSYKGIRIISYVAALALIALSTFSAVIGRS
jgi:hypothetical protein